MAQYIVICENFRKSDGTEYRKGKTVELEGEEETIALSIRAVIPKAPEPPTVSDKVAAEQAQLSDLKKHEAELEADIEAAIGSGNK